MESYQCGFMSQKNPVYLVNPILSFFGKLYLTKSLVCTTIVPITHRPVCSLAYIAEHFRIQSVGLALIIVKPDG